MPSDPAGPEKPCLTFARLVGLLGRLGSLALGADPVELQAMAQNPVTGRFARLCIDATQNRDEHIVYTPARDAADVVMLERLVVEVVCAVVYLHAQELAFVGELVERAIDRRLADGRVLGVDRLVDGVGGGS